ncbi:hypothetical protein PHSY_000873 [Pseudozyma hubeiensis SY62]|uniref:Uncharacterized protein n=1 Tax=Pseudozyma hubeiensis (strain SY62) TaxID=1305764 RepID=R9NXB9_PSEHS|nr:hypothetical protein PHSY_000873 [Pseudozyma hubeiensis SY62]GAC93308.1 hypothetical protein PHSY_000873 [Pseudozyma hubeiensis SY62]
MQRTLKSGGKQHHRPSLVGSEVPKILVPIQIGPRLHAASVLLLLLLLLLLRVTMPMLPAHQLPPSCSL